MTPVTAITTPKNNAVLTDITSTTVTWPAITGATDYAISVNGGTYQSVAANVTSWTIGGGGAGPYQTALVAGSTDTFSVEADAVDSDVAGTFFSRPSATITFTLALPAVSAPPTAASPLLGAVGVDPANLTFSCQLLPALPAMISFWLIVLPTLPQIPLPSSTIVILQLSLLLRHRRC